MWQKVSAAALGEGRALRQKMGFCACARLGGRVLRRVQVPLAEIGGGARLAPGDCTNIYSDVSRPAVYCCTARVTRYTPRNRTALFQRKNGRLDQEKLRTRDDRTRVCAVALCSCPSWQDPTARSRSSFSFYLPIDHPDVPCLVQDGPRLWPKYRGGGCLTCSEWKV